jgi:hypothetical protein
MNDTVAIMANETPSSTTPTTQAFVKKFKKEDTSNNDYHNSDSDNKNKNSIFDDDWKVGNWAWERDYKSNINNNNNNNNNSNEEEIIPTTDEPVNDRESSSDDNDIDDDDEKKPEAIVSSSDCVAATTSAAMEITATKTTNRKVRQEISRSISSRCPQIKDREE